MQVKAWMAEHVFLTVALAVVLTMVVMVLAGRLLERLHLRLFQLATLCGIALGILALVMGVRAGNDHTLLEIGTGMLAVACLSYYAGSKLSSEHVQRHKKTLADLERVTDEYRRHKENSAVRLVVEPAGSKGEGR